MLLREIVSYAPMPSADKTVCCGLDWLATEMVRTTASVPARVDKANWWGAQAVCMVVAYCWTRFLATSRRSASQMMMPLRDPAIACL